MQLCMEGKGEFRRKVEVGQRQTCDTARGHTDSKTVEVSSVRCLFEAREVVGLACRMY